MASSNEENELIRQAIRKIALDQVANRHTGVIRNTEKKNGVVVKIHDEEDDPLFGTVDVQEYPYDNNDKNNEGLHEGVYLSAIQNNNSGAVIIPMLYSEVVFVTNNDNNGNIRDYVIKFSHVNIVQLESHEKISVGVSETEEYDINDVDGSDFDELEKTGLESHTTYTKDSIASTVIGKYSRSDVSIAEKEIELKHETKSISMKDDGVVIESNQSNVGVHDNDINIESQHVNLGSSDASHSAVLGEELADIMIDFINKVSQIKTVTQLGIQPVVNVADFMALKSKIQSYKSSVSGFLSKTVKLKE